MNNMNRAYEEYKSYREFITEIQPKSLCLNENDLEELFYSINDIYKLCNLLIDHEFIKEESNHYQLLLDFRDYYSRILITITLNDIYLVNTLIRLVIEKLYRILYAFNNPQKGANRIRKKSREGMKIELEGLLTKQADLDEMYNDYSSLIHHTNKTLYDGFNLRQIYNTKINIVSLIIKETVKINLIFLYDYFLMVCKDEELDIAFTKSLENKISKEFSQLILKNI